MLSRVLNRDCGSGFSHDLVQSTAFRIPQFAAEAAQYLWRVREPPFSVSSSYSCQDTAGCRAGMHQRSTLLAARRPHYPTRAFVQRFVVLQLSGHGGFPRWDAPALRLIGCEARPSRGVVSNPEGNFLSGSTHYRYNAARDWCPAVGSPARVRAKVAELVDALALGASGVTRESSSLSFRTRFFC